MTKDIEVSSAAGSQLESRPEVSLNTIRLLMTSTEYSSLRKQVETGDLSPWMAGFLYLVKFIDEDDCFLQFALKGINSFFSRIHSQDATTRDEVDIMIAKREKANGFSGIHNRHTVSLWNMLDATLFEGLVHLFLSYPEAREIESFRKIKFTLKDYDSLSRIQVTRMAVAELKREPGAGRLSKGVRTYGQIFESLGIKLEIPDELDKSLIELRALRNAIVHNMGIVDKRVADDCPWLKLTVGTHVALTSDQYEAYKMSALNYVAAVLSKGMTAFPSPPRQSDSSDVKSS